MAIKRNPTSADLVASSINNSKGYLHAHSQVYPPTHTGYRTHMAKIWSCPSNSVRNGCKLVDYRELKGNTLFKFVIFYVL